jgi:hypothetical protein
VAVADPPDAVGAGWAYTEGAWVPACPDPAGYGGWRLPSAADRLAAIKGEAHALRTAERMRREAATYPHDGHRYDCDERSAIRWGLVVSMALLAIGSALDTVIVPSGWRDTEGTPRLYTAAQILAAQQSLLLWGALCDGASQAIASDIEAATDAAAVEAVIAAISTDPRWPA